MKYKTGDIVTIDSLNNLQKRGQYNKELNTINFDSSAYIFFELMEIYIGNSYEIEKAYSNFYKLSGIPYYWIDDMFVDPAKKLKFDISEINISGLYGY